MAFILSLGSLVSPATATEADGLKLGIDVLAEQGYQPLAGLRVGLLTHPAGVDRKGRSTIQLLHRDPGVNLVALYGPEHGIYGDEKASAPIANRKDPRTGLPVYSLYGRTRKPTPKMLAGIDVLVIDLQDVGTRSYTYVSSMKLAMEACFEQAKAVIVLDRPNPIGGLKVDGPPLEERFRSYVGPFPVPYVHGLTIGEIGRMAKAKPGWLNLSDTVRTRGKLQVVPMRGWKRSMRWTDTGLKWVPTSPSIPDFPTVLGYPMTGLGCQLGGFRHGYGTPHAFRMLSFKGKTPEEIQAALERRKIPGLSYEPVSYKKKGQERRGLYVHIKDWKAWRPTELSFHLMALAAEWERPNPFSVASKSRMRLFNKHVGSTAWWTSISKKGSQKKVGEFIAKWEAQSLEFQRMSREFWLYD